MKIVIVLSILIFGLIQCQSSIQYVPITEKYDGLTIGQDYAPFHIEAFFDLMCPDSAQSNKYLNEALEKLQFKNQNQVQVTYHIFPLPYHYSAFYFAQGFNYIHNKFDKDQQKEYINYVLDNQSEYYNSETKNMDTSYIKDQMSYFIGNHLSFVKSDDFRYALHDIQYYNGAVTSSKFGKGLGITGTPTFLINGVIFNEAPNFDTQQWIDFIKEHTKL